MNFQNNIIQNYIDYLNCPKKKRMTDVPSLKTLKKIDKSVALNIAGGAGLKINNAQGIIDHEIWALYEDRKAIGQLMNAADMRKLLQANIDLHISSQKELLAQAEDHKILVRWILEISKEWEDRYTSSMQSNFDIAQKILSIMQECFYDVELVMEETALKPSWIRQKIYELQGVEKDTILQNDDALIRFLFRNPHTNGMFVRMASKILQKKEVCNRPGSYSSRVQRNDITIEKDIAHQCMIDFLIYDEVAIQKAAGIVQSPDFKFWIMDHKTSTSRDITESG